ncbi:MAG: SDR family oxidoreductase [Bdellovibrionota bacterium]
MRKTALITGGTSGIGFGIAQSLAPDFDLALTYASNDNKAEIAKEKLLSKFSELKLKTYKLPLYGYEDAQELHRVVTSDFEQIDALINAAGRVRDGLFMSTDFSEHNKMITEHLTTTMALTHLVIMSMYKKKFGRIINFSSITAKRMKIGQVNYTAVKSGIEGFTKALALETAHRGITINAIAPGLIETPMTQEIVDKLKENKKAVKSMIPAGYIGQPDDIGETVKFLCSDKARYITGQVIAIDGGRSLGEIS